MKRLLTAILACLSILGARPTFATEFDAETGLMHMGARDYDPETGRFLQEDPEYQPGQNSYMYAFNNPVIFSDPSGTYPSGPENGVASYENFPGVCPCPAVPAVPAGHDFNNLKCESQNQKDPRWLLSTLGEKGPWDVKYMGSQYDAAGNFAVGVAGASFGGVGMSRQVVLRFSGFYKQYRSPGTYSPLDGTFLGGWPYGNAADKQHNILNGMNYVQCSCQ